MIRHISMFTLRNAADADDLTAYLKKLTEGVPGIAATFAAKADVVPEMPPEAPVAFPHVIQVLDFENADAAAAWPASQQHLALQAYTADTVVKVTAMDFTV